MKDIRTTATAPASAPDAPASSGAPVYGGAAGARSTAGATGRNAMPAPRATLGRALRAEALKSRHAAPVRLAVIMAVPLAALGLFTGAMGRLSFSPWNYWYVLLMPVTIALVTGCAANADARLGNRALLGAGAPLALGWWAKALWCLALSLLTNLVVFAFYLVGLLLNAGVVATGQLPAAVATMLACATVVTVTSAWMIPAGLFLTARAGMLAGIFGPLAVQLAGTFGWSAIPAPQLFPPSATAVIPTAFIPVLPSGEPLAADTALGGALAADGTLTLAGLVVAGAAFILLTAATAAWFAQSEEVR